ASKSGRPKTATDDGSSTQVLAAMAKVRRKRADVSLRKWETVKAV
ncbi:hypothetical protein AVEN_30494-1, partial [Araneus ventricosus]